MAEKTLEQLNSDVQLELDALNAAVRGGYETQTSQDALKAKMGALNARLMQMRADEFAAMDILPLFKEYVENPWASTKKLSQDKKTLLYSLGDSKQYVPFVSVDEANRTRTITTANDWAQKVRLLRYNLTLANVKADGSSTSNIALSYDDAAKLKELGWAGEYSIGALLRQLSDVVNAIMPLEYRPKRMIRADVRQLMRALLVESGTGHKTNVSIRTQRTFEQKLFAVIKARLDERAYNFADEDAKEASGDSTGNETTTVQQPKEEPALDLDGAQDESAQAE